MQLTKEKTMFTCQTKKDYLFSNCEFLAKTKFRLKFVQVQSTLNLLLQV